MSEILYDKSAGNTVGYCDFRENRLRKWRLTGANEITFTPVP